MGPPASGGGEGSGGGLLPKPKKNPKKTFRCHRALSSPPSFPLAVHVWSFLPARISSAGRQHSFPTARLCLDIPTPPSVPLPPRRLHRKKKKRQNKCLKKKKTLQKFSLQSNKPKNYFRSFTLTRTWSHFVAEQRLLQCEVVGFFFTSMTSPTHDLESAHVQRQTIRSHRLVQL